MKSLIIALYAVITLCVVSIAPAFAAQPADMSPGKPGLGWGKGGKGAPGPIAGMGLPFLIAAGAAGIYRLIRRREDSHSQHDSVE
jgi:hypothetical protein